MQQVGSVRKEGKGTGRERTYTGKEGRQERERKAELIRAGRNGKQKEGMAQKLRHMHSQR